MKFLEEPSLQVALMYIFVIIFGLVLAGCPPPPSGPTPKQKKHRDCKDLFEECYENSPTLSIQDCTELYEICLEKTGLK